MPKSAKQLAFAADLKMRKEAHKRKAQRLSKKDVASLEEWERQDKRDAARVREELRLCGAARDVEVHGVWENVERVVLEENGTGHVGLPVDWRDNMVVAVLLESPSKMPDENELLRVLDRGLTFGSNVPEGDGRGLLCLRGYESRLVRATPRGSSANVYLPVRWKDCKVVLARIGKVGSPARVAGNRPRPLEGESLGPMPSGGTADLLR